MVVGNLRKHMNTYLSLLFGNIYVVKPTEQSSHKNLALVLLDCHFSIIYDRIKPILAVVIFVYRHLGLEWFNIVLY